MARTLRLRLAGGAAEAKKLRNELHRWLLEAGINGSIGAEIVAATNEAFVNAVEHPRQRRSCAITVSGHVNEKQLVVEVGDDGHWQEQTDPSRDHYGQSLMAALMTSVRVERSQAGTTVVLTRRLSPDEPRRRS